MREAVRLALLTTHVHTEAVDAAFVQAKAVATLARVTSVRDFDSASVLEQLHDFAHTDAMKKKLGDVIIACRKNWSAKVVLNRLCTPNRFGRHFQIRAVDAVACGLWTFAKFGHDPERCICETVELGGDTDTVGAMAGALVGALHGTPWLPLRWYMNIENENDVGRDRIVSVASRLAQLDLRSVD